MYFVHSKAETIYRKQKQANTQPRGEGCRGSMGATRSASTEINQKKLKETETETTGPLRSVHKSIRRENTGGPTLGRRTTD